MKKCKTCGLIKPLSEYYKHKSGKDGYRTKCKDCDRDYTRNKNKGIREKNQEWMCKYLEEHPCVHCGETDIRVLEFNHLGNKTHNIADLLSKAASIKKIKKEIDKCEVLCANCHKRFTARQQNNYKHKWLNKY